MSEPSVLIVGAGALGLVVGYHLQLGGTRVSFLVRPGRVAAFSPPQKLYCYDDNKLKIFDGYRVVDQVSAVAGEEFDYVIFTLDGASSRSPQGTTVLKELGEAFRAGKTVMIMGGVGLGLREHILKTTGFPEQRLLSGSLALLSHQVSAALPVHAPTDAALLNQAGIAYHHFPNRASFMLDSRFPEAARQFVALYEKSGISRCVVMNKTVYAILSNAAFPMLAASEIAGWPNIDGLVAQRELWHLACRAQNEIAALPQHGWIGRLVSLVMTAGVCARIHRKVEKDSMPLDYQAFNRFHHGGKVHAQDVEVMRNCLASGQSQGRPMRALAELLNRLAGQPA